MNTPSHSTLITTLLDQLQQYYVSPEIATHMAEEVRQREEHGDYHLCTSDVALADVLTEHLRSISHDPHLKVSFHPPAPPHQIDSPRTDTHGAQQINAKKVMRTPERAANYGFEHVERLPGNVGYLRLTEFADAAQPETAGTAAAAMAFLRYTDALIIDLRRNFGGHPSMVALLLGYLLGPEPILYSLFYDRPCDTTTEAWTTIPPDPYGAQRPVVILTSGRTASAAESFTYFLHSRRRAIVVGGKTLGAANPGGEYDLGGGFTIFIPTGQPLHPPTGANWEGVGVQPDVEWTPDGALRRGHFVALQRLLRETNDPEWRRYLEGVIESIDREA